MVREVQILGPLRAYLFSTLAIGAEVHRHMVIGTDLEHYIQFEGVDPIEVNSCPGYLENRSADFSLVALARRFELRGHSTFLITKDRTFVRDLARAGLRAQVVPPTGFAEGVTVLAAAGQRSADVAHRIQNNAFVNLSRAMRLVRRDQGEAAYADWQEFLNSRTAAKHDLVAALRATSIVL